MYRLWRGFDRWGIGCLVGAPKKAHALPQGSKTCPNPNRLTVNRNQ
jgi:hypothetical protein